MLSAYSSVSTQGVLVSDTGKMNLNVVTNFLTDPRLI